VQEIAALIPALDCETTLGELVRGTLRHLPRVLVVDDGSADRGADVAKAAGAEVLRLPRNRGKAAALRTGMQALRERGATHALTLDADGQHLPGEIPALRDAASAHPAAIVIGARRHAPGSMTAVRLFGNRFANRWVESACGRAFEDTQSGFRVYPLDATLALGCRAERFAFETEVLIRAVRAGLDVVSVPVRVYNPPVGERVSHFRGVRDATRIVLTVVRLLLQRR
jgi:glycosyltransferase involved in cell wall biosynthesis